MWGASTSAYQVEGNNTNSDWWEWEQAGGTEPSGKACDHYNRYPEDFRLAKELGHNAHRLGVEWSRLEKEKGRWDWKELDHYRSVINALADLGIEPIVTLNHFTLPRWLAREGGWLNSNTPEYFAQLAVYVMEELGDKVRYWITINEPNILAILAYFQGIWTPCHKDFDEAVLVLKNMLKGHALAYKQMNELAANMPRIKKPAIGIAKAVTAFHPCSPSSPLDRLATYYRSLFHNYAFINSLIKGRTFLPGTPAKKLPAKKTLDFIGLNYYFRQFIHYEKPLTKHPLGEVCSLEHHKDTGKTTDMGWEIYPRGIYEVAKSFSRYKLPIMITENGLATTDEALRQSYIMTHLNWLLKAIDGGAPVVGYLHWSLLDNFEWDKGYTKRFGLVHVDYKTQQRTIKDSARYYASIIKNRTIAI